MNQKDQSAVSAVSASNLPFQDLTERILAAFFRVYNNLGYGFLEKVYENALLIELKRAGLSTEPQRPITVRYDEQVIGEYFADLLVEDKVIVEIKATKCLAAEHEAQLLNYLKATEIEVGLLAQLRPEAGGSAAGF